MPAVTHWRGHSHGRAIGTRHHHAADVRNEPGHTVNRAAPIAPVGHVERRDGAVRRLIAALPGHHELFGMRQGQRPQQGRIGQREDGAVGADAECKGQHRHYGEARG